MKTPVYRNLEIDKYDLKNKQFEIINLQLSIDNLEYAIEFGRCIKCDEPLSNLNSELCDDCLNIKIDDLNEFIKKEI